MAGVEDATMWGVNGWVNVVVYAAVLVAVGAVVVWQRWPAHPPLDAAAENGLDEYDVAMINGGGRLACVVALANLDRSGALELGDRLLRELAASHHIDIDLLTQWDLRELGVGATVTLLRAVPLDAHPVEQAVYQAARRVELRVPEAVIEAALSSPALTELRSRLARLGLVRDAQEVASFRRQWRWFLPLFVLGGLRLSDTPSSDGSRPWLIALLGATTAAMLAVGLQMSPNFRRRQRLIAELRRQRRKLESVVSGRGSDAMALALLGPSALWSDDRLYALALGAEGPKEVLATTRERPQAGGGSWVVRRGGRRSWGGGGGWGGGGCGWGGCGGGGG